MYKRGLDDLMSYGYVHFKQKRFGERVMALSRRSMSRF